MLSTCYAAPNTCPLINDYVKKDSRGQATALYSIGYVLGDLLVFGILLNLTKNLNPNMSFGVVSTTIIAIGILFFVMVKEPNMEHLHECSKVEEVWRNSGFKHKITILSSHLKDAFKSDLVLPICFLGVMVVRLIEVMFSTFVLLWITDFVD